MQPAWGTLNMLNKGWLCWGIESYELGFRENSSSLASSILSDSEHSEHWLKILNRFWTFWTMSEQNLNIVGSRLAQWVRALNLTTNTSLSPIRRGFAPSFVHYKKGAIDSQSQVIKFTICLPRVGGSIRYSGFLHH
jgi:hypothetical protein